VSSSLILDAKLNTMDTITEASANTSEIISSSVSTLIQTIASNDSISFYGKSEKLSQNLFVGGRAFSGPCPVDCTTKFYAFISIVCILKFSGATGRTSNFLVSVR
jgi:hypothetical protein